MKNYHSINWAKNYLWVLAFNLIDLDNQKVFKDKILLKIKIKYDRWVLSEGHINYFKDRCLVKSKPTFQFLTYLNLVNYGHIIKSM